MRNLLIGLFLGAVLTAGIGVTAGPAGPKLTGRSGPLNYFVVAEGEVVCDKPWVNVERRIIECYFEEEDDRAPTLTAE